MTDDNDVTVVADCDNENLINFMNVIRLNCILFTSKISPITKPQRSSIPFSI